MINDYLRLIRPQQWYKNLVIFLAIFFNKTLFDIAALKLVFLGFIALCLISSANYVFNDIFDRQKDKLNPEKKNRPLASGKISVSSAYLVAFVLIAASLWIGSLLGKEMIAIIIGLFGMTLLYTLYLKHELFIDIISIALNFVLRAVAGGLITNIQVSPWLIVGTFFLSIFLSLGKRIGETKLLKVEMNLHRKTLEGYARDLTKQLLMSAGTILIVCFSLYSFLSEHKNIIITLPLFVYLIYRYIYLMEVKNEIARNPEKIVKDMRFMIVLSMMIIISLTIIYKY